MNDRTQNIQTIIIDDDLVIGQMQIFMLKKMGIENPLFFSEGQKAIDHLDREASKAGSFFILLDLNMPEMNGWDFLEICKIKSYAEKLHVVIVTSSLYKDDMKRADHYPQVIGYFQKSLSVQEIKEIIALQEELPVSKEEGTRPF